MQQLGTLWKRTTARFRTATETEPSFDDQVLDFADVLVPTPIYISHRTRLILLAAIVLGVLWLFMEAPSIPRLLLIGATVALILSFPVRLLEHWMPRGLAILVVVGSTVTMAIVGVILIIPFAINEITGFAEQLPEIVDTLQTAARDVLMEFYGRGWIDQSPQSLIDDAEGTLIQRVENLAGTVLNNALDTLARTLTIAITTFGVIFVATYLLIDIPRFKEKFVSSFSPAYRPDAAQLWATVGESLSRYLAGLMISIVIQGAMATIALLLLDVPYAIVLGLWMSVTAILPYVGAFLGGIPAVLIAFTISWEMAVIVTAVYVVINQVEGNLITPKIQGSAVRVHPLLIFISVIAGSQIAGLFGAIVAVPTLAVVRVFGEFLWLRLQVRHGEDTVLAALGGDDDDDEDHERERRQDGELDGDINIRAEDSSQINIAVDNDSDVRVRAQDRATVTTTSRDGDRFHPDREPDSASPPVSNVRPKPTVKRRRAPRKHTSRSRTVA
ncbi:MAG: AI-2E family transporter [Chloroflexia bacterium]|nr:AI-2E family transporter [Chloroflexia bacterium]